jgi:hypothetical protein
MEHLADHRTNPTTNEPLAWIMANPVQKARPGAAEYRRAIQTVIKPR